MGWLSDFISNPIGTLGDTGQKIIDNPVPAITAAVTQNPSALLAYAAPTGTAAGQQAAGNLFQGSLGIGGQLAQNRVSREAAQEAQRQALAGGQTAANMAAFRPVGTTTRFGTSAYSIDPVTGGLKADYTLSPEAQAYQTALSGLGTQGLNAAQRIMNLGQQYVGESPEAVRQRYIETQRATLAPEQEQQLAGIRNRLFQTGRGGLATGATEAGGLAATNPEMAAYYNSLAKTERQLAADAETAYQNQINFGTGLLGKSTAPFTDVFGAQKSVEAAAQQPFALANELARLQSTAGGTQGQLYGQGAQRAAGYNLLPELQTSTAATLLGGLASPTSGLGGLFSGFGGGGGFTGNPSGLGIGGIDYGNLSTIYSGGNPFEGILGAGETWYGE